eukprot:m.59812 g.59812  ORF g.59812 m.59812 type:complete len:490 (-) comp22760_c0_seq1:162-1631(-)
MAFFSRAKAFVLHPISRRVIRVARVGVIGFGIYSIGRTSGSLDVLKDPNKYEKEATVEMLKSMAAYAQGNEPTYYCVVNKNEKFPKLQDVQFFNALDTVEAQAIEESDAISTSKQQMLQVHPDDADFGQHVRLAAQAQRVHRVGSRLIDAAAAIVREEIDNREQGKIMASGVLSAAQRMTLGDDIVKLKTTLRTLTMPDWKFLFVDSPGTNAFVHGLSPRTVYVMSGLLDVAGSSDAVLAMVLAHEIAHTVHEHCESGLSFRGVLMLTQLMLLSLIDPTGLLTLFFEVGLAATFPFFGKTFDRGNEIEADGLGLEIAAKACYKPEECLQYFRIMHKVENGSTVPDADSEQGHFEVEQPSNMAQVPFAKYLRAHPFAEDRLKNLDVIVDTANVIYIENGCVKTAHWYDRFVSVFRSDDSNHHHTATGMPGVHTGLSQDNESFATSLWHLFIHWWPATPTSLWVPTTAAAVEDETRALSTTSVAKMFGGTA